MIQLFQVILIFFFVFLNGFFVAAEFAFVKVRPSQIEPHMRQGSLAGKTAWRVIQNLDAYLSACQVGITFASLALGWLGEPFIAGELTPLFFSMGITSAAWVHGISFTIAFGIITYLHIVLGEMAPKSVSIRIAEKSALLCAIPLDIFYKVFRPFIALLNQSALVFLKIFGLSSDANTEGAHTEEELKLILAHSAQSGHLSGREAEIMENVLALHDKTAKQIMIPRTAVVYLTTTNTFSENLQITLENQHTRYPLCSGDLDHVIGMVHIKDILAAKTRGERGLRMAKLKRNVIFYPETISLDQLFREFQRTKLHMAVLIDEYGGTTGIVTLEDVLEELVGEIYDEFDQPVAFIRQVGRSEYIVDGLCPVKMCEEKLKIKFPDFDVETIGGMVFCIAGHIPEEGSQVDFENGRFMIESIDRQRIAKVRLRLENKQESPSDKNGS